MVPFNLEIFARGERVCKNIPVKIYLPFKSESFVLLQRNSRLTFVNELS